MNLVCFMVHENGEYYCCFFTKYLKQIELGEIITVDNKQCKVTKIYECSGIMYVYTEVVCDKYNSASSKDSHAINDVQSQSIKNDFKDHKLRWDLLPLNEIEEIVKVYTAGAEKYGENRWQNLPDGYNRYKAAMFRHLIEFEKGNEFDDETGCRHLAQVCWNAIAMLHSSMKSSE